LITSWGSKQGPGGNPWVFFMKKSMIRNYLHNHLVNILLRNFCPKDSGCAVAQRSSFAQKFLKKILTRRQRVPEECILRTHFLNIIRPKGDLCATAQPESFGRIIFKKLVRKIHRVAILVLLCVNVSALAAAKAGPMTNDDISKLSQKKEPFYGFVPYVPQKREYGFELGAMWEDQNLYWIGAYTGFHLGTCVLSDSQTCQQYLDVIGGVGGRDGLTEGLVLGAIRWQFISFPRFISPSVRLFVGAMNLRGENRNKNVAVYGVGYGLSAAVHPAIDLKLNFRVGGGEKTWSQTFFTVSVKIDHVVNTFAKRLQAFGKGAVSVTEKVIKGTGSVVIKGTGTVIKGTGAVLKDTGRVLKKGATVIKEGVEATGDVIISPLTGDDKEKKSDK
jgi:hypothetical protein